MKVLPKAIIFDLDGVITDTAELHFVAWRKLANDIGIEIDRQFNESLKGIGRMESLEKILALDPQKQSISSEEKEKLANQKNEYYKSLLQSLSPKDILPGIPSLIDEIKQHEIKIGLGSASKNATLVLEKLELINEFDYIVDASKVKNGKPHPETFITAADYFGVPYHLCIGIEDAPSGVDALKSAGMFAVGVGQSPQLSHADFLVDSTDNLSFEEVIAAYQTFLVNQ